jgi:hypothetical protein
MDRTHPRIRRAGLFVAAALSSLLLRVSDAKANYCAPKSSGDISSLSCFTANYCNLPSTNACYIPTSGGCPSTVKVRTPCNPTPGDYQVTLWEDDNYQGDCITFEIPPEVGAVSVPRLGAWGFNDCINSLRVGAKLRLHAYRDVEQGSGGLFYQTPGNEPVYWQATYEPGPQNDTGEYRVNSSMSSLVIVNRANLQVQEPLPFQYLGDYPDTKHTQWSDEAQRLCHNKDYWFFTREKKLPSGVPAAECMSWDKNHNFTGGIVRWPLEAEIWSSNLPAGALYKDLSEYKIFRL